MKVEHIGYAVKKIENARKAFENLGFAFGELYEDCDRNIYIQFGENDGYKIELVAKLDKTKDSPIDGIIGKVGPSAYHICYSSNNLTEALQKLQSQGFKLMLPPAPAVAFQGRKVAFLMNLALGLIEVVEE